MRKDELLHLNSVAVNRDLCRLLLYFLAMTWLQRALPAQKWDESPITLAFLVIAYSKAMEENGKNQHRPPTLSIAVGGSVMDNAQSAELATLIAGQIARTAAIFNVDEVVVIDESPGLK